MLEPSAAMSVYVPLQEMERDIGRLQAGLPKIPVPLRVPLWRILSVVAAAQTSQEDFYTTAQSIYSASPQYVGRMKSFSRDCKYGFIECADTMTLYGKDVWVSREVALTLTPGAAVRFTVHTDQKGFPVGDNVARTNDADAPPLCAPAQAPRPPAGPSRAPAVPPRHAHHHHHHHAARYSPYPAAGGPGRPQHTAAVAPHVAAGVSGSRKRYVGNMKEFSARDCKYAFIQCPETEAIYGKDIFVQKKHLGGLSSHQQVSFEVAEQTPGRPEALNIIPDGPAQQTQPPMMGPDGEAWYYGRLKAFGPQAKFAFIECPDTHAMYGKDVYVTKEQAMQFAPLQEVRFTYRLEQDGTKPVASVIHPLQNGT